MLNSENLLLNNVPNAVIKGFPYVERHCPYCQRMLKVWRAVHIQNMQEHYKAVLLCNNPGCGAYDEECKEAYVRVYYSSQLAYDQLELIMGPDPRNHYKELRKT